MSNNLEEMRHEILVSLEADYLKDRIPAKLAVGKEGGAESLVMILDNAAGEGVESIGEFFFLPLGEDDKVQFFVNMITITQELAKEHLSQLCTAVAAVNAYVLSGAFAIDYAAKSLVYKNSYEMPVDIDRDRLRDNVEISMGTAARVVESYGQLLLDVNDGKMTSMEMIANVLGVRDEQ